MECINKTLQPSIKNVIFVTSKVKKIRNWTPEEDHLLIETAKKFEFRNWNEIATFLSDRTGIQCSARFKRIQPGIIKGPWTAEEDEALLEQYKKFGKNWSLISKYMPTRSGKQIRDRFINGLDKNIIKDKFTPEEDEIILKFYKIYGSCWSKISKKLPGRTGDMIKNRFYSSLRKIVHKDEYSEFLKKKRERKFRQKLLLNKSLKGNKIRRKRRKVIIGSKIQKSIKENSDHNAEEIYLLPTLRKTKSLTQEDYPTRDFILSQYKEEPKNTILQFRSNSRSNNKTISFFSRNSTLHSTTAEEFDVQNRGIALFDNTRNNLNIAQNNSQQFHKMGDTQLCQLIKNLMEKPKNNGVNKFDLEMQLKILQTLQTRTLLEMNSSVSAISSNQINSHVLNMCTNPEPLLNFNANCYQEV